MPIDLLLKALFSLLISLGLLFLCFWAFKRMRQNFNQKKNANLEVLESLTLDPRNRLLAIRYREEEYLLHIGPASGQFFTLSSKPKINESKSCPN